MINPDISDDITTIESIAIGGASISTIESADDVDLFRVQLIAGETYEYSLDGLAAGPLGLALTNPELSLYDAAGDLIFTRSEAPSNGSIAVDDSFSAVLSFTATQTGDYYIGAASFSEDIGDYTINFNTGALGALTDTINSENAVADTVIDVYFARNGEAFDIPVDVDFPLPDQFVSIGWSQAEIDAAMSALSQYSNISTLTFQQTDSIADADFTLVVVDDDIPARGGFFPEENGNPGLGIFRGRDDDDYWTSAGLAPGGEGYALLLHEFGHGLGLAHPHDSGDGTSILQNVGSSRGDYGLFDLNQGVFSTMNYNPGWPLSPAGPASSETFGLQGTMMALDIAVIQDKYGANTIYNNNDNTYVLPDANSAGTFWSAHWDTGGTDEIIYAGAKNVTIDLRAATLQYEVGGGGFISYADGILGGFTIANGVEIENATGGSGDDKINGNEVANLLWGQRGNDRLDGGVGEDSLDGGAGLDTLFGGDNNDSLFGGTSSDTLFGDGGHDTLDGGGAADSIEGGLGDDLLIGDFGADTLRGEGGHDTIIGGQGKDSVFGREGNDSITGGRDDDRLYGGDGDDTIDGGARNDSRVSGQAGDDLLFGGTGTDSLYGGDDNDTLDAEGGNDLADGGSGDDSILGGTGSDLLFGGDGADTVDGGNGKDTIDGGVGADSLLGGAAEDSLIGNDGNDTIEGGNRDDTLRGKNDDDHLHGGNGNDQLFGGNGNDTLMGDDGDDTLAGNAGHDQFNFSLGDDADEITGFKAGAGSDDVIAVSGFGADFDDFAEILAATHDDGHGNTVIDFGGGDTITLIGVDVAHLDADDFVFV